MSAVTASFPVRRQDFGFEEVPRHWVDSDPFMTHLFNALSALFPDGERFFVDSVRAVRDQINDPQLQKDIGAFIGQEAMHAKEHGHFNEGAIHQGFDIKKLEGWTRGFLSVKSLPLLNLRSWAKGLNRVWGPKGVFTAIIPEYLDYFKPDFHPWQHDTEFLLRKWRKQLGFA